METAAELILWKELTEHRAWNLLREIAEKQQQQRILDVMNNPAGDVEAVALQNYMKGEVSGIGLLLRTPLGMIESLTQQLGQERAGLTSDINEENEENEETTDGYRDDTRDIDD